MSHDVGKMLLGKRHFKNAIKTFEEIIKNKPNDLRANFFLGKIYYDLNNLDKSLIYYENCRKIEPNNPNVLFNLSLVFQSSGKIEKAKKIYLKLISINKEDIKSYFGLHMLGISNITDEIFTDLQSILKKKTLSLFNQSMINYLFSKIKKKNKEFENEGKLLKLSHSLCYQANYNHHVQSNFYYNKIISKNYHKIKFINDFKPLENFNNLEHIFIVGLPRSGSSLVETIINHNYKNLYSFGEFHAFNTSILNQISEKIYSKDFDNKSYEIHIDTKKFQEELLQKYCNHDNKTFIDKSLENFFNIDLILKFFPEAKFINTIRNYKDSIIAIYQTLLPELSWCHTIGEIKNYIDYYNETMDYFRKKYPEKILDVNLDNLTNHKENETKKILRFLNISVSDNYLDFDKNEKLFNKTNSFLQVRQNIKSYEYDKYKKYYYLLD